MLDDRKAAILRAVVEEYVETAQPVGSSHLARSAELDVSPATIRNEMAALERDGFLAQPHTSAGRIPTEKGYRFFVDAIDSPGLVPAQRQKVRAFFDRAHGELEQMLAETSRMLSDLTTHTAVVVAPAAERGVVRSVQLVALSPRVVLVVVVLGNGTIEKRTVEMAADVLDETVAVASSRLAARAVGHPVAALAGRPAGSGGSAGSAAVEELLAGAVAALTGPGDDEAEHVFVGGAARTAQAFDAVQTVRRVLELLEHQLVVVSLLHDVIDRGMTVAIGSETRLEPLAECSVVVAPYEVDGERAGTIGVLGPTRMNYSQALAAVATVSERLGRRLREG